MLENYTDNKKKVDIIFLYSIISLGLLILSTQMSIAVFKTGASIILGFIFLLLAILFHFLGQKANIFYLISFLLNTIANGLTVSAYYNEEAVSISLGKMLIAVIPAILILVLTYLLLIKFLWSKKSVIWFVSIIDCLLLGATIFLWINIDKAIFSFVFFSLLVASFYIGVFGISVNEDIRPVLRDVSFGSFGAFIILTVVVLAIISEGDLLSGADIGIVPERKKKRKKF